MESCIELEVERPLASVQADRGAPGALDDTDEDLGDPARLGTRAGKGGVDGAFALPEQRELGRDEPAGAAGHAHGQGDLIHVVEVPADADARVGEILEWIERAEGQAGG